MGLDAWCSLVFFFLFSTVSAGKVTRRRAEELTSHGVAIKAYVDIDPRKIGNRILGRPVLSRPQTPGPDCCFVLSYVATPGAGEDVRLFLEQRGFVEGRSYLLCA